MEKSSSLYLCCGPDVSWSGSPLGAEGRDKIPLLDVVGKQLGSHVGDISKWLLNGKAIVFIWDFRQSLRSLESEIIQPGSVIETEPNLLRLTFLFLVKWLALMPTPPTSFNSYPTISLRGSLLLFVLTYVHARYLSLSLSLSSILFPSLSQVKSLQHGKSVGPASYQQNKSGDVQSQESLFSGWGQGHPPQSGMLTHGGILQFSRARFWGHSLSKILFSALRTK